ncbi:MAG TPA: hypothetical protein VF875_14865 [Anaeromyxobacter sp.]
MPRFFGLSSRDAAFVAASIRPVENPAVREFIVTSVRNEAMAVTAAFARPPPPESPSFRRRRYFGRPN